MVPKECIKRNLEHDWWIVAHEGCGVFKKGLEDYAVLDWEEELILRFRVRENGVDIIKCSWGTSFKIDTDLKVLFLHNEPIEEE